MAIAAVKVAESSGRRAAPSSRSAPVVVDSALQEAPAPAAPATRFDPKDIVGKKVKKHFTGHGWFVGTITEYLEKEKWYQIKWSDGKLDDVYRESAMKFIRRYDNEETNKND